jgi:hypothetical protein
MPVDAEPASDANGVLIAGPTGWLFVVVDATFEPERARHKSHFATCPNAGAHRKKTKGARP